MFIKSVPNHFIYTFIWLQLLVDNDSREWVLATLNSCVNENNVLDITSFFCDVDIMIANNDQTNIIDSRLMSALKIMTSKTRAQLRRLECVLFEI